MKNHVTRTVVGIRRDVGDVVDFSGRNAGAIERRQHIIQGMPRSPLGDSGVDSPDLNDPAVVLGKRGIITKIRPLDHIHEPPEDAVAIACNECVLAIRTLIGVTGRNARQAAAGWLTHRTEDRIFGQQALHHVEDRFVERHIDHLAISTILVPMAQSQKNTDHAVQRRKRVAYGNPDTNRCAARFTAQMAQAAHRFTNDAESWPVTIGAGLAVT